MFAWEEKIETVKTAFSIKSNKQLEEMLGLSNGYVGELIKGKNKNPAKIITAMVKVLHINPKWFYNEASDPFGDNNVAQQENPEIQEKLRFLDSFSDHIINIVKKNGLNDIETRLTALESLLKQEKPASEKDPGAEGPLYVSEAGP
ncbi:MAG: helix-turn-helix transcriptional regulator [Treponema sp.]|jgi:transcriptional regulator with XRE-family HTH domain|nr:helix-turn-helix transcriptional regulator [Treponema sp.]